MSPISDSGTLYLCATPIGNLEDMTYRAVRILKEVDIIAAEDTRHTRKLLSHFDIHTPLISYHEHNKASRGQELIQKLQEGQSIAVVSDAGIPGISDPGADLVSQAIECFIPVVSIPGANAALTALIVSGLDTTTFTFCGFLPKTNKKRRELLHNLVGYQHTLIFYESPHRLMATLEELQDSFGDRQAVAARELTKKFEEFVRGTLTEIREHFSQNGVRGEFTVLVAGKPAADNADISEADRPPPIQAVKNLIATGVEKKDAIRKVASEYGLSRRSVYQAVLSCEEIQ